MLDDNIPSFEALAALAKEAPVEFEAIRVQLCKHLLGHAPEHMARRLKGLQFQLDMKQQRSKTALKSCLETSKLMNNSFMELEQALSNPQDFLRKYSNTNTQEENASQIIEKRPSAEIIQLFPSTAIIPPPLP